MPHPVRRTICPTKVVSMIYDRHLRGEVLKLPCNNIATATAS